MSAVGLSSRCCSFFLRIGSSWFSRFPSLRASRMFQCSGLFLTRSSQRSNDQSSPILSSCSSGSSSEMTMQTFFVPAPFLWWTRVLGFKLPLDLSAPQRYVLTISDNFSQSEIARPCLFVISIPVYHVFVICFTSQIAPGELLFPRNPSFLLHEIKSGRTPDTFVSRALGEPGSILDLHVSTHYVSN